MTDWQPIETAPEGQDVLLAWAGSRTELGYRSSDGMFGNFAFYFRVQPTHWMPLPEPPAQNQERE